MKRFERYREKTRRSRQQRVLRAAREWHSSAESFQLSSLPGNPHGATVRTRFRRLCVAAARDDVRWAVYRDTVAAVSAFVFLFGAIGSAAVVGRGDAAGRALFALGVFFVISALFIGFYEPVSRIRPSSAVPALFVVSAVVAGIAFTAGAEFRPELSRENFDRAVLSCLAWGALQVAGLVAAVFLLALTDSFGREWRVSPDVIAFRRVVRLMAIVAARPDRRAELERRARGARLIGSLADDFQVRMGRALAVPDAANDALLREKLRQIASSIRSYQIDIVAPGPESWANLRNLARQTLFVRCTGSLGAWGMRPSDAQPKKRTRLLAAGRHLRSLVVAVLPLSILIPLNILGYLKPDAVARTAMTIGVIWAIVGLLAIVDPLFSARLQATKDIASLFKEPKPDAKK